jgi:hypothetical protein
MTTLDKWPNLQDYAGCLPSDTRLMNASIRAAYSREQQRRNELVPIGVWISTKDHMPVAGVIVKRWKNGAVWAGPFSGNVKESSFDAWMKLPT